MKRTWALAWIVCGLMGCGHGDHAQQAPIDAKRVDAAVAAVAKPDAAPPAEACSTADAPTKAVGTPLPADCHGSQAAAAIAAADAPGATLDQKIASVVPTPDEEKFLSVPWRTNLMAARDEAQTAGKPVFLWIMVGNPQGCT